MEIELKYSLLDEKIVNDVSEDEILGQYKVEGSENLTDLHAIYFDTEDKILNKNHIAFRYRREGKRNVATLKWGGETENALHQREELNAYLEAGDLPDTPDISVFSQSDKGKEIIEMIEAKILEPIMEVNVIRYSWQIEDEDTVLEICFDKGEIVVSAETDPVHEMEIELITGNPEKLKLLGEKLADKYDLKPEKRSKYERGLALLGR